MAQKDTSPKIDGRKTIQPPAILQAQPIREGTRQLIVNTFLQRGGKSNHSRFHMTLAYIIDYCEKKKIPYTLTAIPGRGYLVKKLLVRRLSKD